MTAYWEAGKLVVTAGIGFNVIGQPLLGGLATAFIIREGFAAFEGMYINVTTSTVYIFGQE
jgi:hypothetical protein